MYMPHDMAQALSGLRPVVFSRISMHHLCTFIAYSQTCQACFYREMSWVPMGINKSLDWVRISFTKWVPMRDTQEAIIGFSQWMIITCMMTSQEHWDIMLLTCIPHQAIAPLSCMSHCFSFGLWPRNIGLREAESLGKKPHWLSDCMSMLSLKTTLFAKAVINYKCHRLWTCMRNIWWRNSVVHSILDTEIWECLKEGGISTFTTLQITRDFAAD